jgi:glucokinase
VILAGDVGGTKTNVGFFEIRDEKLVSVAEEMFLSDDFTSLESLAQTFVQRHGHSATQCCFGVAGPVYRGRCKGVNLPWIVDGQSLARSLGIDKVHVINDLESTAYSLAVLGRRDVVTLAAGNRGSRGNAAVIAAGTGLGEGGLYWDGTRHHPFACEGGHCDFGPRDALENELLVFLAERYDHVSWERLLSGSGLVDMYRFFHEGNRRKAAADVVRSLDTDEGPATVSRAGLEKRCPVAVSTLDRFVSIYGAEGGNLALKIMATGGVYIGGGIAPKIIAKMKEPTFMESFLAKGRMRELLMIRVPVRVIMTNRAALLGAAQFARLNAE